MNYFHIPCHRYDAVFRLVNEGRETRGREFNTQGALTPAFHSQCLFMENTRNKTHEDDRPPASEPSPRRGPDSGRCVDFDHPDLMKMSSIPRPETADDLSVNRLRS
ncbi:MAG: hypothetical protein DWH91_19660 [Planctomycetota bacterium]|nr:MAG: hypothetical protein DWH91_19660 [Planctomycetota bacterium]